MRHGSTDASRMRDSNCLEGKLALALREQAHVADIAPELCRRLRESGLDLVSPEFGGFPWTREPAAGRNSAEEFELEMLRRHLGSWTRVFDSGVRTIGYESVLLECLEREQGIPASAFNDLSRSPEIDARIRGLDFAGKYTREALIHSRSEAIVDLAKQEKAREVACLGRQWVRGRFGLDLSIRRHFWSFFRSHGFVEIDQRDRFRVGDYFSNGSIDISFELQVAPFFMFPVFMNFSFSSCRVSDVLRGLGGADYFKPMELIASGFGRYRTASSEGELALIVFAYERLLEGFVHLAGSRLSPRVSAMTLRKP